MQSHVPKPAGTIAANPATGLSCARACQHSRQVIYFVLVDRFARTNASDSTPCAGAEWCGGTLQGLTSRLDYIQSMRFDCDLCVDHASRRAEGGPRWSVG
eukprot:3913754-Prymnesium_polylepis.2